MTYPISNRRESLTVDFFYIRRQVGAYLDIGYSHALWDDEQNETVKDIIRDGLQQYYFPPPLLPPYSVENQEIHEWTFLRPIWEFTTIGNQRKYPLPPDFERPIGDITYPDTDNAYEPIPFTNSLRLRKLQFQQEYTSHPVWAAIDPNESQGDSPQELTLVLHPTPDAAYNLTLQYYAHARPIDEDHPYPLGGQMHGYGIIASCLAVAELRKEGSNGPMYKNFMETLAGNIVRDRERGAQVLGYNGNYSGIIRGRGVLRHMDGIWYNDVTYGNVAYNGGAG